MSQSSDNSRTFRVLNLTDDVKTKVSALNVTLTQHENVHYIEASELKIIADVKALLDSDSEIKYKQCSYSTFVRFTNELTLESLNKIAADACENVNILYSRVDENNHTGKLVVDRLEDYNKLKNTTGDVSFYRFSPVNTTRGPNRNNSTENNGNWQTVNRRPAQGVRGQYTQARGEGFAPRANAPAPVAAPAPVSASPATRGAGRGRGRGRGVARGPPA